MEVAEPSLIAVDTLVSHPNKPEWGPGRVLDLDGSKAVVYFRDLRGERIIDTRFVKLTRIADQVDPFLGKLPPFTDGEFQQSPKQRGTFEEGVERFRRRFPLFFSDPDYRENERGYKWAAHQLWSETLGGDELSRLLGSDEIEDLRKRAIAVVGRTNLLGAFEKAAFSDALRDPEGMRRYFRALLALLREPDLAAGRPTVEAYLHAVDSFRSKAGKTSPAKWTVATVLPFLANPERFMFLKPEVTKDCAARLTFDLQYRPQLNWFTFNRLRIMSGELLRLLQPFGARDLIDVQSFIWVVGQEW